MDAVNVCSLLHVGHTQGHLHMRWHEDKFVLTGTWALGGDGMISH